MTICIVALWCACIPAYKIWTTYANLKHLWDYSYSQLLYLTLAVMIWNSIKAIANSPFKIAAENWPQNWTKLKWSNWWFVCVGTETLKPAWYCWSYFIAIISHNYVNVYHFLSKCTWQPTIFHYYHKINSLNFWERHFGCLPTMILGSCMLALLVESPFR